MEDRVIYSGNNHVSLVHMKQINPAAECNLGFYQPIYRQVDYTKMLAAMVFIRTSVLPIPQAMWKNARLPGLKCRVWAPDEPEELAFVMGMGWM